jgi:hypothetical protein
VGVNYQSHSCIYEALVAYREGKPFQGNPRFRIRDVQLDMADDGRIALRVVFSDWTCTTIYEVLDRVALDRLPLPWETAKES